mgnify:CR=1 FL=1
MLISYNLWYITTQISLTLRARAIWSAFEILTHADLIKIEPEIVRLPVIDQVPSCFILNKRTSIYGLF